MLCIIDPQNTQVYNYSYILMLLVLSQKNLFDVPHDNLSFARLLLASKGQFVNRNTENICVKEINTWELMVLQDLNYRVEIPLLYRKRMHPLFESQYFNKYISLNK